MFSSKEQWLANARKERKRCINADIPLYLLDELRELYDSTPEWIAFNIGDPVPLGCTIDVKL